MKGPYEITVEEAKRVLDTGGATFIDVRDPMSFNRGHIPGAVQVTDGNVDDFVAQTPKNQRLVVYCYHGFVSQGGAEYFSTQGFEDVCSMTGGFEAWRGTYPSESAS